VFLTNLFHYFYQLPVAAFHLNNHAGAAPAQIGMKTGRRKIARFLVKSA
jgi:hypothetical protein